MLKKHKILNKLVSDFDFWISDLSVSVCFGFRASDFNLLGVNSPAACCVVVVGSTASVRHSRMLLAGIQANFGLDPRLKHSGVTTLGKIIRGPLDTPQLAAG